MATTKRYNGESINWTNGGSAVVSGAVVTVGEYGLGVASVDIAGGASGTVDLKGVYKLLKATGVTAAQGAALYWHATNGLTTTTTDAFIGYAYTALVDGVLTGEVLLAPKSESPTLRGAVS
jgi:predicted RecA/RadA family phage recombinase